MQDRIAALDLARTAAICAMVLYHFTYDLEIFGLVPPGTSVTGGWFWLSRGTAFSFLCLSGVSLWLAHGRGVVWQKLVRRVAIVGGAAVAITVATWATMPDRFVTFGILHAIAFGSVAGLAFLRLPAAAVAGCAVAVFAADRWVALPALDAPFLQWLGLGTVAPRSIDFVPVFPWFGAVLTGIALARAMAAAGLWDRLLSPRVPPWLTWPGRHSLAIYLVHQPVLVGAIWVWLRLAGQATG